MCINTLLRRRIVLGEFSTKTSEYMYCIKCRRTRDITALYRLSCQHKIRVCVGKGYLNIQDIMDLFTLNYDKKLTILCRDNIEQDLQTLGILI